MTLIEKRQHQRMLCEISSSFKNLSVSDRSLLWETTIQDISEGGIRFRANQFIPIHNRLSFTLNIPKRKPILVVAQPMWIKEIPRLSQYEIGAQFLVLSEEDKALIQELQVLS